MNKKEILAGSCLLFAITIVILNIGYSQKEWLAAVFFSQGKTVAEVVEKYESAPKAGKLKILLVPGHEPNFGGAEYAGIIERDLNVALAEKISVLLADNDKFDLFMARDFDKWNYDLENYFKLNESEIKTWRDTQAKEMSILVNEGKVKLTNIVSHNNAPPGPALRLYGLNKWANENKIDITLHIHFNDNPKINGRPKFEGFSIYVPEKQYSNSSSSVELAKDLMNGLLSVSGVSTMKQESEGLIEDQELIAIGRYNTAESLVALIEYAYIYESKLKTKELRKIFIDKVALATVQALNNFFISRKN